MTHILESRKSLHYQVADIERQLGELQAQVETIQPMANLGMAWAMTAHELNNLLTPIINYAHYALQYPEDPELAQKALQKTLNLSRRAAGMVERVLTLAGRENMGKICCRLCLLLDEVLDGIGRDFSKDGIRILRNFDENVHLYCEEGALRQVLLNLILNAYQAMKETGGVLTISAAETPEMTRLELSDTGCGIESDKLHTIFDAFYTAGNHNGTGLGLAYCRKVIESHGGCISADSCVGQGTHFKILLPKPPQ